VPVDGARIDTASQQTGHPTPESRFFRGSAQCRAWCRQPVPRLRVAKQSKPRLTGRNCFSLRPLPRGPCASIPWVSETSVTGLQRNLTLKRNTLRFLRATVASSRVYNPGGTWPCPKCSVRSKCLNWSASPRGVADSVDRSLKTENLRPCAPVCSGHSAPRTGPG